MAERKERLYQKQPGHRVCHICSIQVAKHRKSYGQKPKVNRTGNRLYSAAGATSSHRAKGKDEKVKEQLGRTIYSTTALYHDPLM